MTIKQTAVAVLGSLALYAVLSGLDVDKKRAEREMLGQTKTRDQTVEIVPKDSLEGIAQEVSVRFKPVEVRNSVDNLDYKIKTGEYTVGN